MRDTPLDRATPEDVTSLATDTGFAPMQVGAVLVLDTPDGLDPRDAARAVTERLGAVPRLRQRLVGVPLGQGRPLWLDDPDLDIDRHVRTVACPDPGDETALLGLAAELIGCRLPDDRPLWSATIVTGCSHDRTAIVVVFHHVLADGIGGLAVLARLVDGADVSEPPTPPRPAPTCGDIVRDALAGHVGSLRQLPDSARRVRAGVAELRAGAPRRVGRSSLNRPTGPRRRFAVVRVPLDDVRTTAHDHGATVNDIVLAAVAGALRELLESRGEQVDRFVASVPVSARRATTASELGNQVGVAPVELRALPDRTERLVAIAEATRRAKAVPRGASAALLGPAFRTLARLGAFQWFVEHQRRVTTFVTNLRGPDGRLEFLGAPIVDIVPLTVITGNVTVSFAVLSYAGTLCTTIITDPDVCPDLGVLAAALQTELGQLSGR